MIKTGCCKIPGVHPSGKKVTDDEESPNKDFNLSQLLFPYEFIQEVQGTGNRLNTLDV